MPTDAPAPPATDAHRPTAGRAAAPPPADPAGNGVSVRPLAVVRPRAAWAAPVVAGSLIAIAIVLRLWLFPHRILPIGFGIPLVLFAWVRSRRWLWITAAAFAVITLIKFFLLHPLFPPEGGTALPFGIRALDAAMVLLDVLIIAALVNLLIGARDWLEHRNEKLAAANTDLAAREEEVARQNEELQSQAEELERQSEELRVANEELAARERTMETLLSLSRSLATDLSRGQTLDRICEVMGQLISTPAAASAILERVDGRLVVQCHYGFAGGLREEAVPDEQSFAALVLSRGRTGYLEDVALRPDLVVPQPKQGPPFASVLAAPLRVAGRAVGTLEVYGRQPGPWSDAQVALLESLAAQASVSLEAAHLLDEAHQERRRMAAVLRAVPIGIGVAADPECADVRLNPAGAALFNVPTDANIADPAMSGSWRFYIDGRPMERDQRPVVRAARDGEEVHGVEVEVHIPNGRRLVLLFDAGPIRDRDGRVVGAVSAFVDITKQVELQRELDLRRREAEEASVRKTRFLAAVSHDIRTPANAISLLAELIRRSASNPALAGDVPELAQELHGSAISLVNLLSDVLDLARFDSGRIELQEADMSVAALLAEESRQMLPLARDKGLELVYLPPATPIWVRADRIKLSRVLGNLVGNAIKFTDHGEVRVEAAARADGGVEIRVTDTGIGIAPEHQRHIFDEFFQLRNPERDRNKGTGLGLTICRRLVDAMGGRLEVRSEPGKGSTFTVVLPASAVLPPEE